MSSQTIYLFDEYSLDLARGCLIRAHVPVHLRRQSYEVLKYLVENRGHLISKDHLIKEVWHGRAVTDGSLVKCIEEVREALGENARKYVRTERGRGYIFEPDTAESGSKVVQSEQLDIVSVVVEDDESTQLTARPSFKTIHLRSSVLVLLAIVVATAAFALVYVRYSSGRSAQINSIAVLPFVNTTTDPNAAYLSDGLTENLIDELAKLQGIKVIARSSSFTYRGGDVDVQDVGRALGVGAVVTGRLEQRGDSLVVSAELIDVQDRSRLWGGQYTRRLTDLQQLRGEIVAGIAEKLRQGTAVAEERQLSKQANVNPQAYEFYLTGLYHFNQGSNNGIKKALDYFNQAVLVDPNFALAWAWVGRTNGNLGGNSVLNPKDTKIRAKAAVQRALELDETLADAHLALARMKQDEWDWVGAEQQYKRAIELSPSLAFAHSQYAVFLATMTKHAEGLNEIRRAQELDPMSTNLKRREAWLLYLAGRSDEALALWRKAQVGSQMTAGMHRTLGFIYEASGYPEEAIREFRDAIAIDGEGSGNLCYLAGALAVAGRKKEALQIVDRLNRSRDYVSPTELAVVHARLKDTEAVMSLLEKAYAEHDPQLQILNLDPFLNVVRPDPRFKDLLKRVGLPSTPNE